MGSDQLKDELSALLTQTGKAHHEAFAATDGEDPDWAIWYADYLYDRLARFLLWSNTHDLDPGHPMTLVARVVALAAAKTLQTLGRQRFDGILRTSGQLMK